MRSPLDFASPRSEIDFSGLYSLLYSVGHCNGDNSCYDTS